MSPKSKKIRLPGLVDIDEQSPASGQTRVISCSVCLHGAPVNSMAVPTMVYSAKPLLCGYNTKTVVILQTKQIVCSFVVASLIFIEDLHCYSCR